MKDQRNDTGQIPYADILESVTSKLEAFGDEFARLARTGEQKALAEEYGKFINETYKMVVKLGEETLMPTREQMDAVEQKVEWLKSIRYARDGPYPPTPMPDELIESLNNLRDDGKPPVSPSALALPKWEDLSRGEQQAVLGADVNWQGFTGSQEQDVIHRVLEGQEAQFWMDGIKPDNLLREGAVMPPREAGRSYSSLTAPPRSAEAAEDRRQPEQVHDKSNGHDAGHSL